MKGRPTSEGVRALVAVAAVLAGFLVIALIIELIRLWPLRHGLLPGDH